MRKLKSCAAAAALLFAAMPAGATTPQPGQKEAGEELRGDNPSENAEFPGPVAHPLSRSDVAEVAREELQRSGIGESVERLQTYNLILMIIVGLLLILGIGLLLALLRLRSALTGSPAARKGGPLSAVEENLYGSKAVPD
jgi:Flp pilus assembly protein TadB